MKKIIYILPLLLLISITACKKEVYNTYDAPEWATQFGDYSESMSFVIELPKTIKPYMTHEDEMAVFVKGECRGTATIIDNKFFINVQGTSDEMDLDRKSVV